MSALPLDRENVGDRMLAALSMAGLSHPQARVLAAIAWHDGTGGAPPELGDHRG